MNGQCHRCEHQAAIAVGRGRDVDFSKTPCFACLQQKPESSAGTREYDENRILLDRILDERIWNAGPVCEVGDTGLGYEEVVPEPKYRVSGLRPFVKAFMALGKKTRDTLALAFQGLKFREIAARLGDSTPAAVEMRVARAMVWPIGELFPKKIAKATRRRAKAGVFQDAVAGVHRTEAVLPPVCDAFACEDEDENAERMATMPGRNAELRISRMTRMEKAALPDLADAVRGLMLSNPDERDGAAWRFLGWSWKQVGLEQGVTAKVACMRHCRWLKRTPAVRVMFRGAEGC